VLLQSGQALATSFGICSYLCMHLLRRQLGEAPYLHAATV